ncbi:4033_t:CDS:1 [Acaulospora colombiana]|uniref:4033_t:CDS:1 n=1 Tax=Acaulospora colombiana TaxID=27376 RepID=A0ACA9JXU5_9GLOM|nr:4033_t:CDS:1 [Acaulospora colombiana]
MQKTFSDGTPQSNEHDSEIPQEGIVDYSRFGGNNDSNASIDANNFEENGGIDLGGGKSLCRFFQRGSCRYGESCRYSHESSAPISVQKFGVLTHPKSATPCRFFAKGYCRYGDDCKFAHGGGRFHHDNGITSVNEPDGMPRGEWAKLSGEDVNDMMSQGVKPWDEDAQVLEVMNQSHLF